MDSELDQAYAKMQTAYLAWRKYRTNLPPGAERDKATDIQIQWARIREIAMCMVEDCAGGASGC